MSRSPLLEPFRGAYRNLQLLPLLKEEEIRKFRVPYGQRAIAELEQVIEDCSDINNKVIFSGHRGCGKSTLLGELERKLEDHYFIVFFSIAELIEMSDVNHINILFAIALQMMDKAEQSQVNIKQSTKDTLNEWFAKRTRTEIETPLHAEASAGFNLFNIIKGKLQSDATIRNEIKQEFERKTSDLIAQLNEIAAIIEDATQKDVLILIDDLDKLDLAVVRNIYYDHVKALFQPNFRIVFTIPIAALREIDLRRTLETETNNQLKFLEVAKLYPKPDINNRTDPGEPYQENLDVLSDILTKRVDPSLIEPQTVQQIVLKSGGVLRELIRIANQCCSECLLQVRRSPERTDIKINSEILELALNDIRNDFATPLSKPHYDILTTIYHNLNPNNETDADRQKFLDLLHGLYVLKYRNADLWYDLHPIIFDLLKRRCYIMP